MEQWDERGAGRCSVEPVARLNRRAAPTLHLLSSHFWLLNSEFWLLPLAFSSARPDQLIRKADRIKRFLRELRELPRIFFSEILIRVNS